jgi:hypothetical protein
MKIFITLISILAVCIQLNTVNIEAKSIAKTVYNFLGPLTLLGDRIFIGTLMNRGDYLESSNGIYTAVMQYDGNFVVYAKDQSNAKWSTGTRDIGYILAFQTDGNLVVYSVAQNAKWLSRTTHKGYVLVM